MSPELVTALFGGIAALIVAIGVLITKVGDLVKTTKEIQVATNGAASASAAEMRALRDKVHSLEERIVEGQQAAADVRTAMEKAPPRGDAERKR